ncbi:MAG: hypothetical protein RIT45_2916, partial [Pseudomonadota bacterium]
LDLAERAAAGVPELLQGALRWVVQAGLDGALGLAWGLLLLPLVGGVFAPAWSKLRGARASA